MTLDWEQFEELIQAEMRKIYSKATIDYAIITNTDRRKRKCRQ